jgi:hypothetical protein
MGRKLVLVITVLLGVLGLLLFIMKVGSQPEGEWVSYVPEASQVTLAYWKENGTSYMNTSILFANTGYNVSDWGVLNIVGNNISVDAEIWKWTGISQPILMSKSYTYILGNLSKEQYSFNFRVWGTLVKVDTFIVPEFQSSLILPLFMIATLLTVIIFKRKH